MKFDPLTKDIYTENGAFIKTMNCPYKMIWDNLETTNSTFRKCEICNHLIVDTDGITDEDLMKIVRQNPDTCLKIDLNQHNIELLSNGILGQK